MAYRKPENPRLALEHCRRNWAARGAGLVLLLMLALLMAVLGRCSPQRPRAPSSPKTARSLQVSPPAASLYAGDDRQSRIGGQACRDALIKAGATFQPVPAKIEGDFCRIEDAVTLTGGAGGLNPPGAVMMCREALAFAQWRARAVQPQAQILLGSPVASMQAFGAYECRRRYNRADQPVSEHALANAVDIGLFVLADGRKVSVADDWSDPGPKGLFLHAVRDKACGLFSTVLSPDYNAQHHNHLHLDMMPVRPGRGVFCH
jgi:hypothetical protein